jgi:hypothetical protein
MCESAIRTYSLASAAALLEEGISRFRAQDPSAFTCLRGAEAVFERAGDRLNAGIARHWLGSEFTAQKG